MMDISGNTKMSIEQKAKAYDEALNIAKETHETQPVYRAWLEKMFPELRESEDERIRKKLIWLLQQDICPFPDEEAKQMAAYLEKQKYDRMKPIYDARESFESALEKAWNDYHNGYENVDKLEDDYVECAHAKGFREGYLFGIEKQKEQVTDESDKVAAAYQLGRSDEKKQKEQKEIPLMNGDADLYFDEWNQQKQNPTKRQCFEEGIRYAQRLQKEQKPVWSEEDEDMLNSCISSIEEAKENRYAYKETDGDTSYDHEIAWLKSLRPQPHWKPSEEQMRCFDIALALSDETMDENLHNVLVQLREQLKKL